MVFGKFVKTINLEMKLYAQTSIHSLRNIEIKARDTYILYYINYIAYRYLKDLGSRVDSLLAGSYILPLCFILDRTNDYQGKFFELQTLKNHLNFFKDICANFAVFTQHG